MKKVERAPAPYGLPVLASCLVCPIREAGLFCRLPPKALRQLQALRKPQFFPAGAQLFVIGEVPRGVYIICSGKVKLTASSRWGRSVMLRTAGPGEVLGLSSVIGGDPYHVNAITLEPCQVNFIERMPFKSFLREQPTVARKVLLHLSMELHKAWEQTSLLTLSPGSSGKLAGLLLELAEERGQQTPEGVRFVLNMSQGEVGEMIGISRETVNRVLAQFKRRKLISVRGSAVVLLRPDELLRMA